MHTSYITVKTHLLIIVTTDYSSHGWITMESRVHVNY